tara:strand:- start:230 stop:433 length:204 start_codon:yes stop_codon:yes gene_type:complete
LKILNKNITTMLAGMEITNGLSGLKEKFCSKIKLKRKVNKDGAYSIFSISTCAGVTNIKKDNKKISK